MNENNLIKPNVLARIRINDFSDDQALLVPSIIIKQDLHGSYVYIVNQEDFTAKKMYLKTGKSYMDNTMITEGLSIGDKVIIQGYNQVTDGSKIKIAN